VSGVDLPLLIDGSLEHLAGVWDEERALFPYSTHVADGRYVNDYDHPDAIRYTINSLLGLAEWARSTGAGESDVRAKTAAFVERHTADVVTCADTGLLTLLLAEHGEAGGLSAADTGERLRTQLDRPIGELTMQDLGWALWGACGATRAGVAGADSLAARAFDLIRTNLVVEPSRLPRHSTRRYRRDIVSFGSLVYYLRSLHEYAHTAGSHEAESLFDHGVRFALGLQGPQGEWPWLLDARSGRVVDGYPVFSVHQDSMAMLWVLPARDRGLPGAAEAIPRSLQWGFGENELDVDFYVPGPFVAHRSIERAESAPRLRRYLRSLAPPSGAVFGNAAVRLNPECRSYHLGWVLFAWAGRPEAQAGTLPAGGSTTAARR
jgi:hypothetical protein